MSTELALLVGIIVATIVQIVLVIFAYWTMTSRFKEANKRLDRIEDRVFELKSKLLDFDRRLTGLENESKPV